MPVPRLTLGAVLLAFLCLPAVAGPTCNVPQERWMPEADFKARLLSQGYQIKLFKVTSGRCYEIYGFDKEGRKVEIYFDPSNAAILEQKS